MPVFAPEPKVILTTGSPRLPVHNCALENKKMKIPMDKKNNRIAKKQPGFTRTDQVVLITAKLTQFNCRAYR